MPCTSKVPKFDLEIYKGDDEVLKFRYLADGVAVDLTGYIIDFECSDPTLSRSASIADQGLLTGEYSFVFDRADTELTESVLAEYEVVFWPTGLSGNKKTVMGGNLYVTPERVL